MTRIARLIASCLVLLALSVLSLGIASAHAKLKSSVPAADAKLAAAPTTVSTTFDNHDALNGKLSLMRVTDAQGRVVDMGDTVLDKSDADRKTLIVSLQSGLGAGVYTVAWTAVSEGDASVEEGSFNFTVGTPQSPPTTLPKTGEGSVPLVATLMLALALLFLGGVVRKRGA